MDQYHLQTFCRVARRLNFSRAAEELSLSQSAVSRHIEALECEMGMELFARAGRGVALTEAGQRLLIYAERILRLTEEARRSVEELSNLESGRLTIGASTTPGNYVLGPVVAAYQERYPGIELRLDIRDSQSVLRLVEEGSSDVAVCAGVPDSPSLTVEPCLEDELMLVAAPHHPLAGKPEVTLRDLKDTCFFIRESGSHTRQLMERVVREKDFFPRFRRELGSTEAIKRTVAAGAGVAYLSRFAVSVDIRAGLLKPLAGPDSRIPRQFFLVYPKGERRPPAVLAFAALLHKMRPGLESSIPV